jgi:hypothetical protein
MNLGATLSNDLLTIYLNDHLGGATFGRERARRAAAANAGTEFGPPLTRLATEIESDRDELLSIMKTLGRGRDPIKVGGGWLVERMGALKLNGRIVGYSPLSRVLDLEALEGGVGAKLGLWRALRAIAPKRPELDEERLDRLVSRAEDQRHLLGELHTRAADLALAPGRSGA